MTSTTNRAEGAAPLLVSVITVCLNAELHLATAMESVLTQGYPRIEYIVIDGVSSDGTLDVIRKYEPRFDGRMRWISEPDVGLYDAMNKGVAMATGELIGILNADDFYEPDTVERVVATWLMRPEAGVIYGRLRVVEADGQTHELSAPHPVTLKDMLRDMVLYHPGMFVTARTYGELGQYDTRYPFASDYEFLLRALDSGIRFAYAPGILASFSVGGMSTRHVRAADHDATLVRIAYGVSPFIAWARFYKRILFGAVYGRLNHIPMARNLYSRYKDHDDTSE